MMPGFRRSQLRGSDELFRPTQPEEDKAVSPALGRPAAAPTAVAEPPSRPEGRLVRLSDDDITLLADAIQKLKFPTSQKPAVTKPSVAEFERLEELRQRLLSAR